MVIYIESVFAFNVLVDYLLLFGAARVAGRTVARRRLLLGAAVGGIYAAVQLFLPKSVVLLLLGLALMGAAAYRGSGRAVKLTLLFFLASCGLAGVVMLLGHSLGSMARLARGVVTADLPWGVFLIAAGAVHGDERPGRPRAVGVQGAGEEFLAHPRFPGDEDVDVARGGLLKFFQRFEQGGAFSDDVRVQEEAAGLVVPAAAPLHGLRERLRKIADAERLDQIFPRAGAQGGFGGVGAAVPGDDDHVRTSRHLRERLHMGEAVAVRQQHVQKHDVHPAFREGVLFFWISFNIVKKSVSFFRNSMKKRPFSAVCLDNVQKP